MIEITILEFWSVFCGILISLFALNSLIVYYQPLPYDVVESKFFEISSRVFANLFAISLILAPVTLVLYFWALPNVYVIEDCGKFQKKILVNPFLEIKDTNLSFGNHCYVINNSYKILHTDAFVYGAPVFKQKIEGNIPPNTIRKFDITHFDDVFENPPSMIKTKSYGSTRYYLGCNIY